jgi:transposase
VRDAFAAEIVADKGYHKAQTIAECAAYDLRTYIPERTQRGPRRGTDKPAGLRDAFHANRRRVQRDKSRRLQRLRSERTERSFAHVCNTGGARRAWLRGVEDNQKRYLITLAGRNLTLLMRALFEIGTPRSSKGSLRRSTWPFARSCHAVYRLAATFGRSVERLVDQSRRWTLHLWRRSMPSENRSSSTGC